MFREVALVALEEVVRRAFEEVDFSFDAESGAWFQAAEAEVRDNTNRLLKAKGTRSVDDFHRDLGNIMWDNCGMARSKESLEKALQEIPVLREEFYRARLGK